MAAFFFGCVNVNDNEQSPSRERYAEEIFALLMNESLIDEKQWTLKVASYIEASHEHQQVFFDELIAGYELSL